jgi:hypothetical protein
VQPKAVLGGFFPIMKVTALASLLATTSFALTLAGCGASSSGAIASGSSLLAISPRAADPTLGLLSTDATSKGILFVANGRSNAVDIYDKNPPNALLGEITKGIVGPNGMAVDTAGDLFVANVDNQTVTEYPPGSTKPSRTYTKGFNGKLLTNPLNVAVGNDGTLYLVNYTFVGNGSEVLEYPSHSLNPSLRISMPGGAEGLALDHHNNLYVSYNGARGGQILKFAPHSTSGKDLGILFGFAGGLAFDGNENLLVCDQTAPAIYVFPPGATKPSKTITGGFSDPYHIAFGQHFARLYVADSAGHDVLIYRYPAATIAAKIHRQFTAYGVALNPPAPL